MKIKNIQIKCFLVACISTIIIAALSTKFLLFSGDQLCFIGQAGFILLQIILVVKYAVGLLLLMPRRVILKQMVCGFLSADMLIATATIITNSRLSFSAYVAIGQILLIGCYWVIEERRPLPINNVVYIPIKNELLIEDIT